MPTAQPTDDARPPEPSAPHGRTRRYLAGVVTACGVAGISVAINLWLTPFTLRFLDREEYALFVFANDLLTWLVLLDLGMTAGLRAQAAQLTGRPDPVRLNRLASTTFFTQLVIALLMLVAGAALAAVGPGLFHVRPELHGQASTVLLLLALATAVNFATQTFSSLLFAHQQLHYDNFIRVAQLLTRAVVTVLLLRAGWKVHALAVASLVSVTLFSLLAVARAYTTVRGLSISRRLGSRALLWADLKRLNLWFAAGGAAGAAIQSLDGLVAARLLTLASVATLTLTGRVYAFAFLLLTPLTAAAQAAVGQLIGAGERAAAFDAYRRLWLLSTGCAAVAGLSLWSGNAAFVTRWVGAENYGGAWLDTMLMLNLLVFSWVLPNRMALVAGLCARPQALTRVGEMLINLCLSVALARRYGLAGVAAATTVAALLTSCWLLPRLAAEYFGRSSREVLRGAVVPLLPTLLVLAPLAAALRSLVGTQGGYAGAFLASAAVGACGAALLWRFTFDAEMRERAVRALQVSVASAGGRVFK